MTRDEKQLNDDLERVLSHSAAASVRFLAAAEEAVLRGQFNIAKVLRASAHAARLTALNAARRLAKSETPADVVSDASARFTVSAAHKALTGNFRNLADILLRAARSLESSRDVLESDVAQSLWGCHLCGTIVEGAAPQRCAECGAFAFEFEWFGPFYSSTYERLGRRSPEDIVAILRESPHRLRTLVNGTDEEQLIRRRSPNEWCAKEIAGHLVDVTELFCWRVRTILNAPTPPSLEGGSPPWRLLDDKGYPAQSPDEIVRKFERATGEALAIFQGAGVEALGQFGLMRTRVVTVLDQGVWLANHNIAHLAQIEALLQSDISGWPTELS